MKRYAALLLAVLMLVALVGCGEEPATDKVTTTVTTTTTTEATTTTTVADGEPTSSTTESTTEATTTTTAGDSTCAHSNVQDADCDSPKLCKDCNATLGEALGHEYAGRTCSRCGDRNPEYTTTIEVTAVELDKTAVDLVAGETVTLTHKLKPTVATDKTVTWKSANAAIATVDDNGVVTAVAPGETTVTVSSANGKTASCKVVVHEMLLELPTLPMELFYNANGNGIITTIQVNTVKYTLTNGTLKMVFDGELTYDGSGKGGAMSRPNFGWRLHKDGAVVAEGLTQTDEEIAVGSLVNGLTVEVPSVTAGKYRLELYSTYKRKT